MREPISRREALKSLLLSAGALAAVPAAREARAVELPHVTATDPTAVALSYFEDAKQVDAKKFPNYRPEQRCSNCLQLMGMEGRPWRPCTLFPGKLVNANGWCKVYVKKP
jgi:hypothetical protein